LTELLGELSHLSVPN